MVTWKPGKKREAGERELKNISKQFMHNWLKIRKKTIMFSAFLPVLASSQLHEMVNWLPAATYSSNSWETTNKLRNWRWSSYAASGIACKLRHKQLWKIRKSAVYCSSRTFNLTVTCGLRSRGFDDIQECSRWFPFAPTPSGLFLKLSKETLIYAFLCM